MDKKMLERDLISDYEHEYAAKELDREDRTHCIVYDDEGYLDFGIDDFRSFCDRCIWCKS